MKKIVTMGVLVSLLTANLQAIPSRAKESLPVPVQVKSIPSVPPVALGLTTAATGVAGAFCALFTGYKIFISLKYPNNTYTDNKNNNHPYTGKEQTTATAIALLTPVVIGTAIMSGIYSWKKVKAIRQAKKEQQQQLAASK